MKIVIAHHHLNPGGVTRVIENQLLALDRAAGRCERHEAIILHGGRCDGWPPGLADRLQQIRVRLQTLPELDYDSQQTSLPGALQRRFVETLQQARFSPADTIVHLHNYSIGKNTNLPRLVWSLAERGYSLLLQIHDFAEDERPGNFQRLAQAADGLPDWHGRLYPQAPHIHFAVLNGRDRDVLLAAGAAAEQLHLLPNPVLPLEDLPDREQARRRLQALFGVPIDARFVVYPVRGIRRKNVGEAVLHSLLAPEGTCVGLTLPPLELAERTRYEVWKTTVARGQAPFRFEVGGAGGLTFPENLAASDAVLTTSVAEGFGMVYLETWLAARPLMGRDLPEVTRDFSAVGLDLGRLGPRLEVPTEWIDKLRLRQALRESFLAMLTACGRSEPAGLTRQIDAQLRRETIDFGDLDETLQIAVIDRVVVEPAARLALLDANPWIEAAHQTADAELVRRNAEVASREFSLEPSGARLAAVYRCVLNSPRGRQIQPLACPGAILDRFLDFTRFRMLRN